MKTKKSLPLYVYPDANALGSALASLIIAGIREANENDKRFLLGCPGGRSAASTYGAIGKLAATHGVNLAQTIIVMMDDYVLHEDGTYVRCPADAHYSCERFALDSIRDIVNPNLPDDRRIRDDHIWLPDPADPAAYESRIRAAGGIDFFIVASGASDGHVAFNPPGSDRNSTTRIIRLPDSTRRDNLGTFPHFTSIDDVPTHGVSVGVDTIVSHSRAVACVIHGAHKNRALRELVARESFDPGWPVSLIYESKTAGLFVDVAAAADIDFESNNILVGGTQ